MFQGTFTTSALCSPRGVGLSPSGDVYVGSDCDSPFMARFTGSGTFLGSFGFPGGYLGSPNGGGLLMTIGTTGAGVGQFTDPVGIGVDGSGRIYVADATRFRVLRFLPSGTLLSTFGSPAGMDLPFRNACGPTGTLYVSEQRGNQVHKFQLDLTTAVARTTFGRLKAMYR